MSDDITVNGRLGPWSRQANCAGEDPDTFFPRHADPGTRARQICARCPVREDCREYAIDADEHGIWGGLDRGERQAILLERLEIA